jgi:Tripartite tricarboxylate transporter family receptor
MQWAGPPCSLSKFTLQLSAPTFLTVGPKVPADVHTLAGFVSWCRANPEQATYGTAGVGTTLHFIGAMLGRTAGFPFLHVPYQGRIAIQDLLKGEIASTVLPIDSTLGLVQSGNLRALATTGSRRRRARPIDYRDGFSRRLTNPQETDITTILQRCHQHSHRWSRLIGTGGRDRRNAHMLRCLLGGGGILQPQPQPHTTAGACAPMEWA